MRSAVAKLASRKTCAHGRAPSGSLGVSPPRRGAYDDKTRLVRHPTLPPDFAPQAEERLVERMARMLPHWLRPENPVNRDWVMWTATELDHAAKSLGPNSADRNRDRAGDGRRGGRVAGRERSRGHRR